MLFHTWAFAVFFAVVYPVYMLTRGSRFGLYWLFAASYFFYGWWNWSYLLLILYSTLVDWVCVNQMAKGRRRAVWLVVSLVANLGMLGFFKYSTFAVTNLNRGFSWGLASAAVARKPPPGRLAVRPAGEVLPSSRSVLSYTIDYFRGRVERRAQLPALHHLRVPFPQLVAGPSSAPRTCSTALRATRVTWRHIADGASLFW